MPTAKRNWTTARQLDGLSRVRSAEPHGCGARCSETRYEALCGEQEREPLHLVSRDQSDCFALLNMGGSRRNTNRATRHSVMFCERVASVERSLGNAEP